jgi:hypothetical protein
VAQSKASSQEDRSVRPNILCAVGLDILGGNDPMQSVYGSFTEDEELKFLQVFPYFLCSPFIFFFFFLNFN